MRRKRSWCLYVKPLAAQRSHLLPRDSNGILHSHGIDMLTCLTIVEWHRVAAFTTRVEEGIHSRLLEPRQ